jgi:hypothetical protein
MQRRLSMFSFSLVAPIHASVARPSSLPTGSHSGGKGGECSCVGSSASLCCISGIHAVAYALRLKLSEVTRFRQLETIHYMYLYSILVGHRILMKTVFTASLINYNHSLFMRVFNLCTKDITFYCMIPNFYFRVYLSYDVG